MIKKSTLLEVIVFEKSKILNLDLGLERELLQDLNYSLDDYALIISGIRRSGKSTLLKQFIHSRVDESFIYLNFDSAKLFSFELEDFELLDEILNEKNIKFLFFDEIQAIIGWEVYIRQKLDERFKVVITGSNASLLSKELGTKLTGRHITKELFPFNYGEYCRYKKTENTFNSFENFLEEGGFPLFLKQNEIDLKSELINDIIYRDIAVRYNIRDVKSLKQLLIFLATNVSNLISATKLKQYINIKSTSTVLEFLSYFEQSYLIQLVPKFSYSTKVQLVNPKKVYFIDNALSESIAMNFTKDRGRKLENTVFWELRKRKKTVFYFNENGNECDFVVFSYANQIEQVIQVCYDLNFDNQKREIKGLLDAMNYFELTSGTIITMNQEDVIMQEGKRVNVIPAFKYFNILPQRN